MPAYGKKNPQNFAVKVPRFQNLWKRWQSLYWRYSGLNQLGIKSCFRLHSSDTVVLWVPFLLSKLLTTGPLTHTLLPQKYSLSSTRATLGSAYTSSYPLLARMSCPASTHWDPHGVPPGSLPLKETQTHRGTGLYTTTPSSTGSLQHQCNGDKCCQGFPLQPIP